MKKHSILECNTRYGRSYPIAIVTTDSQETGDWQAEWIVICDGATNLTVNGQFAVRPMNRAKAQADLYKEVEALFPICAYEDCIGGFLHKLSDVLPKIQHSDVHFTALNDARGRVLSVLIWSDDSNRPTIEKFKKETNSGEIRELLDQGLSLASSYMRVPRTN